MRIVIGALAVALLAGCSTVEDIRENPPIVDSHSAKSAESVAECIRDGWQGVSLVGGSVGGQLQKSGGRYAVIAPNSETPWHVADVKPEQGGSRVTYRFYRTWQSPPSGVPAVVSRCLR